MHTPPQILTTNDRMKKRHRELIGIGFAIELLDVQLLRSHEETKVDAYISRLHHCARHPETRRPRMPLCLRPWADEAQW